MNATVPAESTLLGSVIANGDGPWGKHVDLVMRNAPQSFADERFGQAAKAIYHLRSKGEPMEKIAYFLTSDQEHYPGICAVLQDAMSMSIAEVEAEAVWKDYHTRQAKSVFTDALQDLETNPASTETIVKTAVTALAEAQRVENPAAKAIGLADLAPDVSGEQELIRSRFLCRGAGLLFPGPTGAGKSSLEMQLMLSWAAGRECFGFAPTRPLRSLLIQAENDNGDLIEMRDGVLAGLGFSEAERLQALANVLIATVDAASGQEFLAGIVRPLVREHRPDVLWLDPLLSYLGGDVSKQETVSAFLRNGLNPILHEFGCAAVVLHHTNKPTTGTEKRQWQAGDFAYLGAGSADLANWARAVVAIRSLGSNDVFELRAGKRGGRLGWVEDDGQTRRYALAIAHDKRPGVICWRPAEPDEVPAGPGRQTKNSVEDILAHLDGTELTSTEWQALCKTEAGISSATFYRLKSEAAKAKLVRRSAVNSKWVRTQLLS